MSNVRYRPLTSLERTAPSSVDAICEDCGAHVFDKAVHSRFHAILGGHAHAIAILTTTHITAHVHDKYEAYDKITTKRHDNWSADVLDEVISAPPVGTQE
jgi:hypothetical protein